MSGEHAGIVGGGLRMNKNFIKLMHLKHSWILKQRFPTFGMVITVADNEEAMIMSRSTLNRYTHVYVYT